jgi:simple sugar transport system substrate-binding protein
MIAMSADSRPARRPSEITTKAIKTEARHTGRTSMFSSGKRRVTVAVLAGLALLVSGCGATGVSPQAPEGVPQAPSGTEPRVTIAMVTHAQPGDTFWDIIRLGAIDAATQSNVNLVYTSDGDAARQAVLVDDAVQNKVDALLVSVPNPAVLTPAIKKATDARIPVVGFNAGLESYRDWGAMMFFGQDETAAGRAAGNRLTQEGATKVLCVIQAQGQSQLEARCDGTQQTFSQVEKIYVTGTDLGSVRSTLEAKLREDPGISNVLALGAPFALTAVDAVKAAGSRASVSTFDTNSKLIAALESGDVKWAVDQQPYLQGFLAVEAAALYVRNGNVIGAGQPVLTGQAFIDSSNVDQVIPYAKSGKR